MPIRLNLDRVMSDREISLTELADRIGITLANLSILKTNKARAIRFTTLEALCRELKCQPGDLLFRRPWESRHARSLHPRLRRLRGDAWRPSFLRHPHRVLAPDG
jgi:putative transcriptional regulator